MRTLAVLALALAGCIGDNVVDCGNGIACPGGTRCATVTDPDEHLCVSQEQLDACNSAHDHAACTTSRIAVGRCYGGACLPVACGNGRVDRADPNVPGDVGETCDDGNNVSGDGCSADCMSNETCGNGVLDGVNFEQCDDGNLVDHDGCDSTCRPERAEWTQLHLDTMPPLDVAALAYDVDRGHAILFGGTDTTSMPTNQTWRWNGRGWSLASTPAAPSARAGHSMAYDSTRRRLVMFGGTDDVRQQLADTWEWDGNTWSAVATPISPSAVDGAAMAYDSARHRIVMFGGHYNVGLTDFYSGDTSEFDGTSWRSITTSHLPPGRAGAAMAYDPVRGRVVMFGGGNRMIFTLTDTWEYDGSDWTPVASTGPVGRASGGMSWDAVGRTVVLFGGYGDNATLNDTWRWDGLAWTALSPATSPPARAGFAIASDPIRGRIVIVGGDSAETSTWEWDGVTWIDVTPKVPAAVVFMPSDFDADAGVAVTTDGVDTWASDGASWFDPTTATPHVYGGAIAYDATRHQSVMFGGQNASTMMVADTWLLDHDTWTQAMPALSPSPRDGSAAAFDRVHGRVVLFGGTPDDNSTVLGDTWLWDGTTWTDAQPVHRPPARANHMLAYDPIRDQIVMFGGLDLTTGNELGDLWIWDGADWSQLSTAHTPGPREGGNLVWNGSRRRLLLFGGDSAISGLHADTWEWDGTDWTFVAVGSTPHPRMGAGGFRSRDGAALVVAGGDLGGSSLGAIDEWQLQWHGEHASENCVSAIDTDGDGLAGCADPDCWYVCTPHCPPGATCDSAAPHCGDGICNAALENCHMCPQDCGACPAVCGDASCDASETLATCPGDCSP